jgi:hypothetical protein
MMGEKQEREHNMNDDGSEFLHVQKLPRTGFSSVGARKYLGMLFPDMPTWIYWILKYGASFCKIVQTADQQKGNVGVWRWERVEGPYPSVFFWNASPMNGGQPGGSDTRWAGILRFTGPDNETFLLFSYMNSSGLVGSVYYVSTHDTSLLERFDKDVHACFRTENTDGMIEVSVTNGPDIYLAPTSDEQIYLPASIKNDIEQQVLSFFRDHQSFVKFNIPYRRGFLFVGAPGGGKTMMIRHLIRQCHAQFKPNFMSINIKKRTDEDDIASFFEMAAKKAPCMVILEDLESLTKESAVSRSALLNQLDGLKPRKGLLVIGTTNNPEDIDPALIHRPSRFDRIWIFEMPDKKLRREYLEHSLPGADPGLITDISEKTADWSFAYLNELRTTASILAIQEGSESIIEKHIEQAFVFMTAQFKSNKNGHKGKVKQEGIGFEKT